MIGEDKAGNKFYDLYPDAEEHTQRKASKQRSDRASVGEHEGSPEDIITLNQSMPPSGDDVNIQILNQSPPTPGDAKGKITFGPNGVDITLLAKADRTTFLHETEHFFFKVLSDLSAPENAPERLKGEFQTLLDLFGVKDRGEITTEHHEQFARGFEAYLMEGKAPSVELRPVFQRGKRGEERGREGRP